MQARLRFTLAAMVAGLGSTCPAQPFQPYWAGIRSESVPGYDNYALVTLDDGTGPKLYVLTLGQSDLYRWEGQQWTLQPRAGLPVGVETLRFLVLDDGEGPGLYIQVFISATPHCFRWRGGVWTEMPADFWPWNAGNRNWPQTTADFGDGLRIYGKRDAGRIARWNGASWEQLGQTSGSTGDIDLIVAWHDGTGPALYVFGSFHAVNGVPAPGFARWDGTSWTGPWPETVLMGQGTRLVTPYNDGTGEKLYTNYRPYIGGVLRSGLHRWDGLSWQFVGGPTTSLESWGLFEFDDGTGPGLYVSGLFANFGGVTARALVRYDGAGFHAIPGSQPFTLLESYGVMRDERGESLVMRGAYTPAIFDTVAFLVGSHIPTCPADCDANSKLNVNDYVCFVNAFAARNPFGNAQPDAAFNVQDFIAFMGRFDAGCP